MPEALRLADELERYHGEYPTCTESAAELRRLSAVEAQRDALLEVLKLARSVIGHPDDAHSQMIDAAIKAAEGEKT